jgi:hypothetical protein
MLKIKTSSGDNKCETYPKSRILMTNCLLIKKIQTSEMNIVDNIYPPLLASNENIPPKNQNCLRPINLKSD